MKLQQVFADKYQVLGAMDQEMCPTVDFLEFGEASTQASRSGLLMMLEHVATNGFDGIPAAWSHEADKKEGIYEFIKGPLRLFYFKGQGNSIAVCTGGARKKGQKANKAQVAQAIQMKDEYWNAVKSGKLEIQKDEDH